MSKIALCPLCSGQKTVSKPPYIAGDINTWVSYGTGDLYQCPTCNGRGYVRIDDDYIALKSVAMSAMETSENLMDECTNRGERIKELESEVDKLRMEIFDMEGEEDLFITDLEATIRDLKNENKHLLNAATNIDWDKEADNLIRDQRKAINTYKEHIKELESINTNLLADNRNVVQNSAYLIDRIECLENDIKVGRDTKIEELEDTNVALRRKVGYVGNEIVLLDDILKIVNPSLRRRDVLTRDDLTTVHAKSMHKICDIVANFRKEHDIVG